MLDEPLRPQTVSASPLLRSALAAGEREPDSRADDELDALFGVDDEMEIAGEHRGEATEAVPSPDPGEEAEIQTEGRDPVILREPIRPSAEAVDKHNATHMPFRSWCPVCVQARGKEDAHPRDRSRHSEGGSLAKVFLDYQEFKSKAKGKPNKDDKVLKIIPQ